MSNETRFGLDENVISALGSVFQRQAGIERVVLYGSRAKGTFRTGSDIDLTLIGPTLNSTSLAKIENEIDDLMLPYKFDISLFHEIDNKSLIEHIERVGKTFWP